MNIVSDRVCQEFEVCGSMGISLSIECYNIDVNLRKELIPICKGPRVKTLHYVSNFHIVLENIFSIYFPKPSSSQLSSYNHLTWAPSDDTLGS